MIKIQTRLTKAEDVELWRAVVKRLRERGHVDVSDAAIARALIRMAAETVLKS